jgi:hypothetical protein
VRFTSPLLGIAIRSITASGTEEVWAKASVVNENSSEIEKVITKKVRIVILLESIIKTNTY